jgi:hypothetical protein
MAGTFTHWMVVEEALDKFNRLSQKHSYFPIILGLNHFVYLGAVGPDYPYLTELLGGYLKEHSWADRMHYENTGDLIRNGIKNLQGIEQEGFKVCLAWLSGFATHLITDAMIHPVVQAIVGPYIFNAREHRHCEMTQDSYIFHEMKGIELRYSKYALLLKVCSDHDNSDRINPYLRTYWIKTLKASHLGATDEQLARITPDRWHKNFLSRISSAADPGPIFRHVAEEKNLAYKKITEITTEEWQRFVRQIKLPGNKIGEFKKDAFEKAVDKVMETWHSLFVDIGQNNPDGTHDYLKNWNLDDGVDEDKQYFWP